MLAVRGRLLCDTMLSTRRIRARCRGSFHGVDEHGGGVCDVDPIISPSPVADAEPVQEHAFLIGEEGEAAIQPLLQPARRRRWIDAHREELHSLVRDPVVVIVELDQLDPTEGSPVAAVENVHRRRSLLECSALVKNPVLILERVGRE